MPELTSVFIGCDACEFTGHCDDDYDDYGSDDDDINDDNGCDDDDNDDDDEEDDRKENDKDDESDDDEEEEEEEEIDASNDHSFVMKSEKQGENERIDLPKLTSFHVDYGNTFAYADSFLFSGSMMTLFLSSRLACSC